VKKSLARGVGVLGSAAALVAVFGSGSAAAVNEYAGQTYEDAASSISDWGTPVIASRVGSYLPTEQCMVTGSRDPSFLDSSGNHRWGTVLLDLNCNDSVASAGKPGYSAASPEGRTAIAKAEEEAAKQKQEELAWLASDKGQAFCLERETEHPEWEPLAGCHQTAG